MAAVSSDLVTFVRARLDEDEATARAAMDGRGWQTNEPWSGTWTTGEDGWPGAVEDTTGGLVVHDEGSPNAGQAQHIANYDPARVLREVEGGRTILDAVTGWRHRSCPDGFYSCSQATEANGFPSDEACADEDRAGEPCDCGLEARQLAILRPLALPYSNHPDYRAEWAP